MSTKAEKIRAQKMALEDKPTKPWHRHMIGPVELEALFANAAQPKYTIISVNYGINRRLQGRHFSHRKGNMRIKAEWNDDATHEKIKAVIRRLHPGWSITGWCLAKTPKKS